MQNNSTIPENDFEVRSLDAMYINDEQVQILTLHNLKYLLFGLIFGIVLIKA
jgi:hypothetical protein